MLFRVCTQNPEIGYHAPLNWMIAIVTTGRGPEASGRVPGILGRSAAVGEGTGSAFFGGGRIGAAEADACPGTTSTRSRSVKVCPRRSFGCGQDGRAVR